MAKAFWERAEADAKKVCAEIIEQINRADAPWQKPWKPGDLLNPVELGALARRPLRVKDPEGTDG